MVIKEKDTASGRAIVIHPQDNVATVIHTAPGTTRYQIQDKSDHSQRDIPTPATVEFGHKIALCPILQGEDVIKYGQVIGQTTQAIQTGDHVHVHNMKSKRGARI